MLQISHKLEDNKDVIIFRHDVIVNFFWRCFVSLIKFSCWSKFHVNIITGSGVMIIFLYKRLTRNPEIGNTPVWVRSISGEWGKLGIPYLAGMSLIKFDWMLQNARVTAFTVSELLREKQQRGKITPPQPRLGLSCCHQEVKSYVINNILNYLEEWSANWANCFAM